MKLPLDNAFVILPILLWFCCQMTVKIYRSGAVNMFEQSRVCWLLNLDIEQCCRQENCDPSLDFTLVVTKPRAYQISEAKQDQAGCISMETCYETILSEERLDGVGDANLEPVCLQSLCVYKAPTKKKITFCYGKNNYIIYYT